MEQQSQPTTNEYGSEIPFEYHFGSTSSTCKERKRNYGIAVKASQQKSVSSMMQEAKHTEMSGFTFLHCRNALYTRYDVSLLI